MASKPASWVLDTQRPSVTDARVPRTASNGAGRGAVGLASDRQSDAPLAVGVWLTAGPDQMVDFARQAENIGCESVWCPEHLIWPAKLRSRYPYHATGAPPVPTDVHLYDPWVLLAAVASATRTIKLGTSVYVLPLRHPLVTARAVATLDVLSRGRTILGAGLGWMAEEYEASGIDFRSRASRCDEIVPLLRALWSQETTEHHGRHFDIPPVHLEPKPPQGAALPIVFGGVSDPALRRAARLGDGWLGTWDDAEGTTELLRRLHTFLLENGRDPLTFEITVMVAPEDATVEHLQRLRGLGVHRVCIGNAGLQTSRWPDVLDRIAPVIDELQRR